MAVNENNGYNVTRVGGGGGGGGGEGQMVAELDTAS